MKTYFLDLTQAILDDRYKSIFGEQKIIPLQENRENLYKEFEILLTKEQIKRLLQFKKKIYFSWTKQKFARTTKEQALEYCREDKEKIKTNGVGLS